MCLIIHKPKDAKINLDLLQSASEYNPHGYGFMAFAGPQKINIFRDQKTNFDELRRAYTHFAKYECVIHLRLRTRGNINKTNTHPFRITNSIYMAHNGTLDINCRVPGRSDSWHMANDLLSPLLRRSPKVIHNKTFQNYMAKKIGVNNRIVFMDADQQQTIIINKALGVEYHGVWLSNSKWFDAAKFGLAAERVSAHAEQSSGYSKLKLLGERFEQKFNQFHFCPE
jgi:predicted glutamine amidotransferase